MTGFEVEIADMDLLQQLFARQQGHLNAIRDYVSGNCTTPGGFGIVLQPLAPHYEEAYADGVTGLTNGATVAQTCSTKIVETKTSLVETDRKQYERYAQHEAALGKNVPPYTPPRGGGSLPAAGGGYTPEGEESKYPSIKQPYTFLAEHGYDAAETAARIGHTPEHAAPEGTGTDSGSDTGASSTGSDSGTGNDGASSNGASSNGASSNGAPEAHGSTAMGHGRHEAPDEPNVAAKATEIYNAPGDYIETGKDVAETVDTRNDLDDAQDGPVNDDQTTWANSGGTW